MLARKRNRVTLISLVMRISTIYMHAPNQEHRCQWIGLKSIYDTIIQWTWVTLISLI